MQLVDRITSVLEECALSRGKFIDAINNSVMTREAWSLRNSNLTKSQLEGIYGIYREGVLDGLMPVAAVTAFDISNSEGDRFNLGNIEGTYDSFFDVVRIFRTMKFMLFGTDSLQSHTKFLHRPMTSEDIIFMPERPEIVVEPLTKSLSLHPSSRWGNTGLRIRITKASGARSIGDNVVNGDLSMKPIPSYHTLSSNVDIIGIGDGIIRHRISVGTIHLDKFEEFVKQSLIGPMKAQLVERDKEVSMPFEVFFSNAREICPSHSRALSKVIEYVDSVMVANPGLPRTRLGIKAALGADSKEQLISKIGSLKGVSIDSARSMVEAGFYSLLEGEY